MSDLIQADALELHIPEYEAIIEDINTALANKTELNNFHDFNIKYANLFIKYCNFGTNLNSESETKVLYDHIKKSLARLNTFHKKFESSKNHTIELFLGTETVIEFNCWSHTHFAYTQGFNYRQLSNIDKFRNYVDNFLAIHKTEKIILNHKFNFLSSMVKYYSEIKSMEKDYSTFKSELKAEYFWAETPIYSKFRELNDTSHLIKSSLAILDVVEEAGIDRIKEIIADSKQAKDTDLRSKLAILANKISKITFNVMHNYDYRKTNFCVYNKTGNMKKSAEKFVIFADIEKKIKFSFKITNFAQYDFEGMSFANDASIKKVENKLNELSMVVKQQKLALKLKDEEIKIYIQKHKNSLDNFSILDFDNLDDFDLFSSGASSTSSIDTNILPLPYGPKAINHSSMK